MGKEEAAPEEQQKECDLAVEPVELGKRLDVSGCVDVSPLPVGGSCAAACAGALVVAAGELRSQKPRKSQPAPARRNLSKEYPPPPPGLTRGCVGRSIG